MMTKYTPVQTPEGENIYSFITTTYKSDKQYISGEFLTPHDKEENMDKRKALVYNANYIKGIIESLLTPTFGKMPVRVSENKEFDKFIEDCDGRGTNLEDFDKSMVRYTRLHSVCFAIMDNGEDNSDNPVEARENREFPFLIQKTADTVYGYDTNQYGAISAIAFSHGTHWNDGQDTVQKYVLLTDEIIVEFTVKDNPLVVKGANIEVDVPTRFGNLLTDNSFVMEPIGETVFHGLGRVPVISLYLDFEADIVMPHPAAYDLARLNWTVYNELSEGRSIERNCAFPSLTVDNGGDPDSINLDIGTSSLIEYGSKDADVNTPEWIAPDVAILKVMDELASSTINRIIEESNVIGATAVNQGNQSTASGTALSYQFIGKNSSVQATARLAETFEYSCASLFSTWIDTEFEYYVKYNDTYVPTQAEIEQKLGIYERLMLLDISPMFEAELRKTLAIDFATWFDFDVKTEDLVSSITTSTASTEVDE